jgi:hypothetical protein
MPSYRIYTFNISGHITMPPRVIQAEDDESAIARAKQLLDKCGIHLRPQD